jgi:hypothetical protein
MSKMGISKVDHGRVLQSLKMIIGVQGKLFIENSKAITKISPQRCICINDVAYFNVLNLAAIGKLNILLKYIICERCYKKFVDISAKIIVCSNVCTF